MAKKDWKKHFLRMKQLANQNLGRYVLTQLLKLCRRPAAAAADADKRDESVGCHTVHNCMGACVAYCYRCSVACLSVWSQP